MICVKNLLQEKVIHITKEIIPLLNMTFWIHVLRLDKEILITLVTEVCYLPQKLEDFTSGRINFFVYTE